MKLARPLLLVALSASLAVPLAAATATTPPPRPNTATTTDARGDVVYVRYQGDDVVLPGGTAPARTMGDVSLVRVKHTTTAVRVLLKYVELGRVGTNHSHYVRLGTPKADFDAYVFATTGAWKGKAELYSAGRKKCAMTWKLDYDANTALVVVPRSCLGRPAWVRVGAGMASTYGDKRFYDDGRTAGDTNGALVLGPRLYP